MPISVPTLERGEQSNVKARRRRFTTDTKEAVQPGNLPFIAEGTPPDDGSADLQYLSTVAKSIALHMQNYKAKAVTTTVQAALGPRPDA